jgi:hypothetical protein
MVHGEITGRGTGETGLLAYGFYMKLDRGVYRATVLMDVPQELPLRVEVAAGSKLLASADAPAARMPR